jgi:hypothetical protein
MRTWYHAGFLTAALANRQMALICSRWIIYQRMHASSLTIKHFSSGLGLLLHDHFFECHRGLLPPKYILT